MNAIKVPDPQNDSRPIEAVAKDAARGRRDATLKALWFLGMGTLFGLVTVFTIVAAKWVPALLFGAASVFLFWSAYQQYRAHS
ncbi:MAG: hypothetical protein ABSG27_07645 [Candidatus Acidiferrales bacterium]|jgi:hypothetical protein